MQRKAAQEMDAYRKELEHYRQTPDYHDYQEYLKEFESSAKQAGKKSLVALPLISHIILPL
jgi:hypothetical protein